MPEKKQPTKSRTDSTLVDLDDGLDDNEYEDMRRNSKLLVKNTFVHEGGDSEDPVKFRGSKTDSKVHYRSRKKKDSWAASGHVTFGAEQSDHMYPMQTEWSGKFGSMHSGSSEYMHNLKTEEERYQGSAMLNAMNMFYPAGAPGKGGQMMMPMPYGGMPPMWMGNPMMMQPMAMGMPPMMMPMVPMGGDTYPKQERKASTPKSKVSDKTTKTASSKSEEPRTTLMLRNLPEGFSRDMVIDMLGSQGLMDKVDFVYVPMNFRNNVTFGYAFVNLVSTDAAEECLQTFEGFCSWCIPSQKVCEVSWSDAQGLEQHIERYRNSPVMHESVADQFKPALFKDGQRQPFPEPTKTLKAPRTRRLQASGDDKDGP